jgi:hypothetical protein
MLEGKTRIPRVLRSARSVLWPSAFLAQYRPSLVASRECGVCRPICPKNSSLILDKLSIMGRGRELCELVRSSEGVFRSLMSVCEPHVRWVQNQQTGLPA